MKQEARKHRRRPARALVTGATGVIGASLVRALLGAGFAVRVFVRASSDIRGLTGLDLEYAYGDLLEEATIAQAAKGCRLFFHAGTPFAYWGIGAEFVEQVAVQGVLNALSAAKAAGVERFVLTSSSVTLGSTRSKEILDEQNVVADPAASPYAASKLHQEQTAFAKADELGIPVVAVCPTVTVGPYDFRLSESNAILVNYLRDPFKATFPGGCNIVSARDVAAGHVLVATLGQPGHRYLLGSENVEWSTVHRMIADLCGVARPYAVANHTSSYLAGLYWEAFASCTGRRPQTTRTQARMVGRYYWYTHARAEALGYRPMSTRQACAEALSWLVASEHVPMSLRRSLRVSPDLFRARRSWASPNAGGIR